MKFTNFAINFFKSYKNLPFSTWFFSKEIRRHVWKLKEHFPKIEKTSAIIASYLNYLGRYKASDLELKKELRKQEFAKKSRKEITEIRQKINAYKKAAESMVKLLHANIKELLEELEKGFQDIELIEISGNALIFRNSKLLVGVQNNIMDILHRIYNAADHETAKEFRKLEAQIKKAKKKGKDTAQYAALQAALQQRMQANNKRFEELKLQIVEAFAAVRAKTHYTLKSLKESAKRQYAEGIEPITAARHTANEELLRYIKVEGKELASLLHEESALKDKLRRAKKYEEFLNTFNQLTAIYLKNIGLAYHLLENDKVVLYRLRKFFERLKYGMSLLNQTDSEEFLISSEVSVKSIETQLEAFEKELHAVLREIADQQRLLSHEVDAKLEASAVK